jgi:hypothetical protein
LVIPPPVSTPIGDANTTPKRREVKRKMMRRIFDVSKVVRIDGSEVEVEVEGEDFCTVVY